MTLPKQVAPIERTTPTASAAQDKGVNPSIIAPLDDPYMSQWPLPLPLPFPSHVIY